MTIVTIIMKMMRMVMITKTTAVKLLVGTVDGGSVANSKRWYECRENKTKSRETIITMLMAIMMMRTMAMKMTKNTYFFAAFSISNRIRVEERGIDREVTKKCWLLSHIILWWESELQMNQHCLQVVKIAGCLHKRWICLCTQRCILS